MSWFLIIILLIVLVVILLFCAALRIMFRFNSDKENISLTLLWLYPFLKAVVTNEDVKLVLTVFLFNKSIFRKTLKAWKQKNNKTQIMKVFKPTEINVSTAYGFRDPFVTGVACGAINIASQFINIHSIQQNPDFLTDKDYIYLNATAKVNLGRTLVKLFSSIKIVLPFSKKKANGSA